MRKNLKLAVVGATGLVGQTFFKILEERQAQVGELRLFASDQSAHKSIKCLGQEWPVGVLAENCFEGIDCVFFFASDDIAKTWAPKAVKAGCYVIDNSAAFRMNKKIALVVPEINGDEIPAKPAIIANPNCTTIQMVMVLKPLMDMFGLSAVRLASYQSVSGAGLAAQAELQEQLRDPSLQPSVFPHPIAMNCIPQIGSFAANGFCTEEMKVIQETQKILGQPRLKVSPFTVRVPTMNAHSEAVWVTFKKKATRSQIQRILHKTAGLVVEDDVESSVYPLQIRAHDRNEVFVGRIHRDLGDPNTWMMWIVADNLRKGAALNALQIADLIF